jgi:hypothetical protein
MGNPGPTIRSHQPDLPVTDGHGEVLITRQRITFQDRIVLRRGQVP